METISMFEILYPTVKIDKPLRLIEFFAGIGSQAMGLRNLKIEFEHHRICEWEVSAFGSYKAIHKENDNTDYSKEITKVELIKILFKMGISNDGKEPLTLRKISRMNEKKLRIIFNDIKATNNLVDITQTKGKDLGITETDIYIYMMTYSFPCQDLSVAGNMKGMTKGTNTRSGLLWEVERLLNETKELPQVLLMENVPQVIAQANLKDFHEWQRFLEEKGYKNYTNTLNAKDYGVAQNRNRTFMVSILGDYNYTFPKPIKLNKTMKDYLEEEVEDKFYIKEKTIGNLIKKLKDNEYLNDKKNYNPTVNQTAYPMGSQDFARTGFQDISYTLSARDYKDPKIVVVEPQVMEEPIKIKQVGNILDTGNWNNPQAGRVYSPNGLSPTLNTMQGGSREPKIVASRGRNKDNSSDRKAGAELEQKLEQKLEPNREGICNTLTTVQKDNLVLESIKIKQATKEGYIECKLGGVADLSYPTSKTRRGRVQDNGDTSPTITATETGVYKIESPYRIRKLTPLECWRLMGFTDEDFYKAEKVNSNSQLYKQAGNSIVVNVLENIFRQMI